MSKFLDIIGTSTLIDNLKQKYANYHIATGASTYDVAGYGQYIVIGNINDSPFLIHANIYENADDCAIVDLICDDEKNLDIGFGSRDTTLVPFLRIGGNYDSLSIKVIPLSKNDLDIYVGGLAYSTMMPGRLTINRYSKYRNITWDTLRAIRNNSGLTPGMQYRIIDYTTTTSQANTQSAGHQFDIIVTADNEYTLNENARAVRHKGDTYFSGSSLESWEIKYDIDNDTSKYAWANSGSTGRGVIYYMKDEWNNECPYDFKNIQYLYSGSTYYYTFHSTESEHNGDATTLFGKYCRGNKIGKYISVFNLTLPKNVFWGNIYDEDVVYNVIGNDCHNNTFEKGTQCNVLCDFCHDNTFGMNCRYNTLGKSCHNNIIYSSGRHNVFGDNCSYNSLGDECEYNTFDNHCYNNLIGSNNSQNTFGNQCHHNNFDGAGNEGNIFGNNCAHIDICNESHGNMFGNDCDHIKFGNDSNYKSYYRNIIVENGNRYIYLNCTGTTSSNNYYQNVKIAQGVNNTTTYKTISDSNVGQTFQTVYQPANSQTISV